jgi:UDP-N-acetylmuramoyl-tripeptide--D-alanyl-D-alanine ligase
LGSREGILKAKLEICDFFDDKSTLVINGDDDMLYPATRNMPFKVISFGVKNDDVDLKAYDIKDKGIDGVEFSVKIKEKEHRIYVKTPGIHNVYNALAAICVGMRYNIDIEKIKAGIESFVLTDMRMHIEDIDGITVINDCYNASPASVKAALKVLNGINAKRRVAILGDMLELGNYSHDAHFDVGRAAAQSADCLLCAGRESENMKNGADGIGEIYTFENSAVLADFARDYLKKGDAVLIKASRGMKFENIYNALKEKI